MNESSAVLRSLPSVAAVLRHPAVPPLVERCGRAVLVGWIQEELDESRRRLRAADDAASRGELLEAIAVRLAERADSLEQTRLGPVINATGVVLHTGLGRAPLSAAARGALEQAAGTANVEIDLATGERRYRGHQLLDAWRTLSGCEDAVVVNNNAAATLLTLQAMCAGREVVISRGQLIEIGGSFRLPDIFALSGAKLKEVGTTNRTRLADYEAAIGPETAAVMHVHPSNYRVVGFVESPGIAELAPLARRYGVLAIDDIGSGCLVEMMRFGLPAEPTFPESIRHGADVVLGSGDKLLGGPQAGIILGTAACVDRIRRHPLARAVRVGKLTLTALAATLDAYLRGTAEREVPVLMMLAAKPEDLRARATAVAEAVGAGHGVEVCEETAAVGGGSLPGAELPTAALALRHESWSADELARRLRLGRVRIVARIQQDRVLIDLRSVLPEDDARLIEGLRDVTVSRDAESSERSAPLRG